MQKPSCFYSVIIMLSIALCVTMESHAQSRDSLLAIYNSQTIHTYGTSYIKGTKQLKLGDMKSEFTSPLTKYLYKKARGKLAVGNLLTVGSLGALVTSVIIR